MRHNIILIYHDYNNHQTNLSYVRETIKIYEYTVIR